jgi:nicotinamidase-related amidase
MPAEVKGANWVTVAGVSAALLVIDMQRAIDDPAWAAAGPRNNPFAEANVARLLAAWRTRSWPIFHIRHDSHESDSTFRPGGPGAAFKCEATPIAGEVILSKHTANAFLSTDLQVQLKERYLGALVVAGVITNNSVESTVRMAAETGFQVTVAEDAVFTFARRDRRGHLWPADDVHALSLANLEQDGYAKIAATASLCSVDWHP